MPASVYLDTNVFIRAFEATDELSRALTDVFTIDVARPALATSELTLSELLVHPYRERDDVSRRRYDDTIKSSAWLDVRPVDRNVLVGASLLRSKYRLKLPDAIHVSTALFCGCPLLLTDDGDMRGAFDFLDTTPDQHWPVRSVEAIALDMSSLVRVTEQMRG